jgi:hypothetical protein
MNKIILYTTIILCSLINKVAAQDTFESKAKAIAEKIETITKEEKATLKVEIEEVNVQLDKGSITKEQADIKKQELSQARAKIIENRVAVVQEELKELVQQKVDGKIEEEYKPTTFGIIFSKSNGKNKERYQKYRDSLANASERRTTSQFVFAMGLNNLVTDGDFENSDYKFIGSHFYEIGTTYNTRIAKNSNLLHVKYGWSVMYNNLRPTNNRFFVKNGDETNLQGSAINLDESRLRNVYLVAPLHLEFDFSGKKIKNDFRFGLGGYAGIRLKTKQILKFDDEFGDMVKQKTKNDFNASNFIYGLSSYIGYKETSLYVKYDLNPLFQDNAVKQNNISLGVRFDLN